MTGVAQSCENGLHLFYHPYSNCSQRVMLLLAEKGVEAEMHEVNLPKSEQLTEEYLRINPKAEVPAIVHNGKAINESSDILRYLEAEFPEPSLSPEEAQARQAMDDWIDGAAASHLSAIANYVYSHGYGRLPRPQDMEFYKKHIPHRAKFHEDRRNGLVGCNRKAAVALLDEQFSKLEAVLENSDWLVGDNYSLADIAWFCNTGILRKLNYSFAKFPNIRHWTERIETRPAYRTGIAAKLKNIPDWLLRFAAKLNNRFGDRR